MALRALGSQSLLIWTPDSPYRPDNPRERQGVRGRGTLHLRGFQQGRWKRAWKTDARFPCEGSERDAGGSIERPRARTERDRERSGAYVQGNGSPASGRRGGRKTGREKRECQKHGGRRHDGR